MKTCSKCKVEQPDTDFAYDPKNKNRLSSQCRGCEREYARRFREGNLEKCKTAQQRYRERNPEKIKQARLRWGLKHPNYHNEWRARNPLKGQAMYLRQTFGISIEQYNDLLEKQGGVCAICEHVCTTGNRLAVDHIHGSNPIQIRGLLCMDCNTSLGKFKESSTVLRKAADYIDKFSPKAENQQQQTSKKKDQENE